MLNPCDGKARGRDRLASVMKSGNIGKIGRSERIRTSDPLLPKQVRYQAALRSDRVGGDYPTRAAFARGIRRFLTVSPHGPIKGPLQQGRSRRGHRFRPPAGLENGLV